MSYEIGMRANLRRFLFSWKCGKKNPMVSMTVDAPNSLSGPRPMDLSRDLKQVATLIEQAFGPELDAAGWAALRELRMAARLGPFLPILTPRNAPGMAMGGFVWVENGKIVGNVTTQRVPQYPSRFLIANVAVDKAWRGRGIASKLMHIVLDHIAEQGGRWAVLQVREDNDIARGMYQRLSFAEIMEEHRLRAEALPPIPDLPLPPGGALRPLTDKDWNAVRYLANRAIPADARWWHPTRSANFREASSPRLQRALSRWIGIGHKLRLGLFFGDELMGVVDADVLVFDEHRVDILLHPDLRSEWARPLLAMALRYLQGQPGRPVSAALNDYQSDAIAALLEFGFEPFLTLVNMRKRINRTSVFD